MMDEEPFVVFDEINRRQILYLKDEVIIYPHDYIRKVEDENFKKLRGLYGFNDRRRKRSNMVLWRNISR